MDYLKNYELAHHGILGQKWGRQQGPPYPLDASDHSSSEKKAGWRKSLDEPESFVRSKEYKRDVKAAKAAVAKPESMRSRINRSMNAAKAQDRADKYGRKADKLSEAKRFNEKKYNKVLDKNAEQQSKANVLREGLTDEEIEYGKKLYQTIKEQTTAQVLGGYVGLAGYHAYKNATMSREEKQANKDLYNTVKRQDEKRREKYERDKFDAGTEVWARYKIKEQEEHPERYDRSNTPPMTKQDFYDYGDYATKKEADAAYQDYKKSLKK